MTKPVCIQARIDRRSQWLFAFTVVAGLLYTIGLIPFVGPDEPRYAQVAREMLERSDWITPTLGGFNWFDKPALLYWLEGVSFKLFGISEFSARLPAALSGLTTALMLCVLGQQVGKADSSITHDLGFWSSVVFVSSLGAMVFARAASIDMLLTQCITVSLVCFFVSDVAVGVRRQSWWRAGFYVFMGLALLAKGLVGIVIPGGVVFWYFLLQRRKPDAAALLSMCWGGALCLLVACAWYAPVISRHGWTFVNEFFLEHHFARYLSNKYNHPQPVYFFALIAPLLVLPWSVVLVTSLWNFKAFSRCQIQTVEQRLRLFALIWLTLPILFFSLSGSKLPAYILPTLPAMALLCGLQIGYALDSTRGRGMIRATGGLLVCLAIVGSIYLLQRQAVQPSRVLLIVAPVLAAGVFAAISNRNRPLQLLLMGGAISLTFISLLAILGPTLARGESIKPLIEAARAAGLHNEQVLGLRTVSHSAEFYAAGRLRRNAAGRQQEFANAAQIAELVRQQHQSVLVLVPIEHLGLLVDAQGVRSQLLADNGSLAIVSVQAN